MSALHRVPPGATPAPRRAGRWRHFHPWTLLIGLLLQLQLGYLLLADHLNPVPQAEQLRQIPIEVLSVRDQPPQLRVRSVDQRPFDLEFPASLALLAPVGTPLQAQDWSALPGCMGYALAMPMRWVSGERLRVWELHCGPVHRVYAEFKASYEAALPQAERAMEWHGLAILLATLAVLALERRVLWRRRPA
jgi:hypothetical protein